MSCVMGLEIFSNLWKFLVMHEFLQSGHALIVPYVQVNAQVLDQTFGDLDRLGDKETCLSVFVLEIYVNLEFAHQRSQELDVIVGSRSMEQRIAMRVLGGGQLWLSAKEGQKAGIWVWSDCC